MRVLLVCLLLAGCNMPAGVVMTEDGRAILTGLGHGDYTSVYRVRPDPLPEPIEP